MPNYLELDSDVRFLFFFYGALRKGLRRGFASLISSSNSKCVPREPESSSEMVVVFVRGRDAPLRESRVS